MTTTLQRCEDQTLGYVRRGPAYRVLGMADRRKLVHVGDRLVDACTHELVCHVTAPI